MTPESTAEGSTTKQLDPEWKCRWCTSTDGSLVLDAGSQPAADHFPLPSDPLPDAEHPMRMVICTACGLVQLESDPTTPEEPRGVEPAALVAQAEEAVRLAAEAGFIKSGMRVLEYPSPHGGSWVDPLTARGLTDVDDGEAEVIVDIFGMMHDADQRAALAERVSHLADDGVMLLQYHTVAAIVRGGIWNALRHGHFAYYSTPVLTQMGRELGLVPVACWEFPLYGGTILLGLAKQGQPSQAALEMVEREEAEGIRRPSHVGSLDKALSDSVAAIAGYVGQAAEQGLTVAGYGAASRTSALLRSAHVEQQHLVAIADASEAKHGRTMPGNRIPIISPGALVGLKPDRVLLFVPDLLDEVRAALPEIEENGGRWVVLDPMPREVEPVT